MDLRQAVERLARVNAKGVKTPKVLVEKLHEFEQVSKLAVNEFTTARSNKLQGAIADILSTLESKEPKDTRVNYGMVGILDNSQMSKRALQYNNTVYKLQLLENEYTTRRNDFQAKIARIQSNIPTGQIEEFNTLLQKMSTSEYQNLADDTDDNE